jgi:hypothetical protein
MNRLTTKASLSAPRRRLLQTMQELNFGRIEGLTLQDGEPAFIHSQPQVIREIRIGEESVPPPELEKDDFLLKAPVVKLFEHLASLGDVTGAVILVKHGLSDRLLVPEVEFRMMESAQMRSVQENDR